MTIYGASVPLTEISWRNPIRSLPFCKIAQPPTYQTCLVRNVLWSTAWSGIVVWMVPSVNNNKCNSDNLISSKNCLLFRDNQEEKGKFWFWIPYFYFYLRHNKVNHNFRRTQRFPVWRLISSSGAWHMKSMLEFKSSITTKGKWQATGMPVANSCTQTLLLHSSVRPTMSQVNQFTLSGNC